ncbi:glutamate-1-semialdehyde 2,1-aminomutase [Nitzschia inconspicua]|uniref:Glutamate-1-semialdehyde 2,1-aminomutase n=1 Tax=Nitzschia inconspicua TaxID=303405 RepID=A0A9K3L5C5_9STRA|nr:glutamate-1-semialdehyde 2,1-aminomutase [Nitzschia inconspicua]
MLGKDLFVRLLQEALSRYVDIDRRHVETKLLSQEDGNVTFNNIKIVPQKFELSSSNDGYRKILLLEGEISKLTIGLRWSSFMILEESWIRLEGVDLTGMIIVERQEENGQKCNDGEFQQKAPTKKSGLLHSFAREYDHFMTFMKDIIPSSQMIQQVIFHLTNTLSITLTGLKFYIRTSDDKITRQRLGNPPFRLVLGFDLFEFLPLSPNSENGKRRTSTVETNRFVHIGLDAFYMDIIDFEDSAVKEGKRLPVVDPPFSYAATLRRVYGTRFVDTMYGFEIVGQPTEQGKGSIQFDCTHGITINAGTRQMLALNAFQALFFGTLTPSDKEEHPPTPQSLDKQTTSDSQVQPLSQGQYTTTFSQILCALVYIIVTVATWTIVSDLFEIGRADSGSILGFSNKEADQRVWLKRLSLFYHCARAAGCTLVVVFSRKLLTALKQPASEAWLKSSDNRALQRSPAVYRLPITSLTINTSNDVRVKFIDVSILGRLDFEVSNFSAEHFEGSSPDVASKSGMRLKGSGMRIAINQNGDLLNLDSINELYVPGQVHLTEPLLGTVVRWNKGIVHVKMKSFVGTSLKNQKTKPIDLSTSNIDSGTKHWREMKRLFREKLSNPLRNLGNASHDNGSMLQKMDWSQDRKETSKKYKIRRLIYEDIDTELSLLKYLAIKFEKIPVKTHVRSLRLYKNSFRGSEAVDFLLGIDSAKSRRTVIETLRQMQTDFKLFEDVTRDFLSIQDDYEKLYRFIPENERTNWSGKHTGVRPQTADHSCDIIASSLDESMLPFKLLLFVDEVLLKDEKEQSLFTMRSGFAYVRPCPHSSALDVTLSFDSIGHDVFLIGNGRIRGFFHPELPREILKMQVSVDVFTATAGYSIESWMEYLGFTFEEHYDEDKRNSLADGSWRLPYVYIAPFSLNLVLKGFIAMNGGKDKSIRIGDFFGTKNTTSNSLIVYFVTIVLGRTPGMLQNVKFLGMDVTDMAGVGTGMTVGAKFIPGGEYMALAALATVDLATGVAAAGKESRGRPDDKYFFGDITRGIIYGLKDTTRKGALSRGKSYQDFYDENDKVKVDPVDFFVGATEETEKYLDRNKARFVGATVGCVATVTLSVFFTPWVGVGAGLLAGQGTTYFITFAEKKINYVRDKNCTSKKTTTLENDLGLSLVSNDSPTQKRTNRLRNRRNHQHDHRW